MDGHLISKIDIIDLKGNHHLYKEDKQIQLLYNAYEAYEQEIKVKVLSVDRSSRKIFLTVG